MFMGPGIWDPQTLEQDCPNSRICTAIGPPDPVSSSDGHNMPGTWVSRSPLFGTSFETRSSRACLCRRAVLPPSRSRFRFVCSLLFICKSSSASSSSSSFRACSARPFSRSVERAEHVFLFSCHGAAVVAGPEDRHWLFCFRSIREEEFDLVERSMRRERKNNVGAFFSSFFTEPARMELGVLEATYSEVNGVLLRA